MGTSRTAIAALASAVLASGCFGYNSSAKRWAYVGDTVLVLGGGGLIAGDLLTQEACMPTPFVPCQYEAPISGALVAGAVLVVAGVVGMVVNATRPNVKTSR